MGGARARAPAPLSSLVRRVYLVENAFRWALGQRYPCLINSTNCNYYGDPCLFGADSYSYPGTPPC